jgi:hypothetical protein
MFHKSVILDVSYFLFGKNPPFPKPPPPNFSPEDHFPHGADAFPTYQTLQKLSGGLLAHANQAWLGLQHCHGHHFGTFYHTALPSQWALQVLPVNICHHSLALHNIMRMHMQPCWHLPPIPAFLPPLALTSARSIWVTSFSTDGIKVLLVYNVMTCNDMPQLTSSPKVVCFN